MIRIEINETCNGCGICVKKCPTMVFELEDKKSIPARVEDCMACRLCEVICPNKGIKVSEDL